MEALAWLDGPRGPELWVLTPGAVLRLNARGGELPGQGGFGHLVALGVARAPAGLRAGGPGGPR